MEMSLGLIKMRMGEIETKLKLLGIAVESVMIDYWLSHSTSFKIRLWMGNDLLG